MFCWLLLLEGSKPRIKKELRVHGPRRLEEAMELAVRLEVKNLPYFGGRVGSNLAGNKTTQVIQHKTSIRPSFLTRNSQNTLTNPSSTTNFINRQPTKIPPPQNHNSQYPLNLTGSPLGSNNLRRLSEKELQEKRQRGLCFRCDDKWNVGHHCKKELSVLLTFDDNCEVEEE